MSRVTFHVYVLLLFNTDNKCFKQIMSDVEDFYNDNDLICGEFYLLHTPKYTAVIKCIEKNHRVRISKFCHL